MPTNQIFDVAVVGAGVFGAWSAHQLKRAGAEVLLVDAYGPANSRSSSGGESRMIRMGYGPDEIYTRMAQRSLALWRELFDRNETPHLFQPTGILWLAHESDPYCEATLETLQRCQVRCERFDRAELDHRYPQLNLGSVHWGILEPDSGVLMARQAVQAVVAQAQLAGVVYRNEAIVLIDRQSATEIWNLKSKTSSANGFGWGGHPKPIRFRWWPWLPKIFPRWASSATSPDRSLFSAFPSPRRSLRTEGLPAGSIQRSRLRFLISQPRLKAAIDAPGPPFDPDRSDRIVSVRVCGGACLPRKSPAGVGPRAHH